MNYLTAITSIFLLIGCSSSDNANYEEITVEEVKKIVDVKDESVFLLDVRTLDEYYGELGHLTGALLIPHTDLEGRLEELSKHKDKKIVVYCRSGRRSAYAANLLSENGYDAVNMTGGMKKFKSEYPTY